MAHPYATRDKIQSRSTRFLTSLTVSNDQLASGQEYADAEIDSRLDAKYVTPFSAPIPDKVVEISADLAAYFIILDIFQSGTADAPVEYAIELKTRAEDSLKLLAGTDAAGLPGDDPAVDSITPSSIRVRAGRLPTLANFDGVNRPTPGRWIP